MVNREDTTLASEATAELLRAAHAFIGRFPDIVPEDFVRAVANGCDPSVTIVWREAPQVFVTMIVDGNPVTCEIQMVGAGRTN